MSGTGNVIQPMGSSTGAASNGVIDLGASARRFKDLRLSGIMYSGTARIGTTTSSGTVTINNEAVNTGLTVQQTSTSVNYAPIVVHNDYVTGGNSGTMMLFQRADATNVGSITSTTTATAFNTGSDLSLIHI